jgi:hypothetical protein
MDNSGLCRFIKCGCNRLQSFFRVVLFARPNEAHEIAFEGVQAGFGAAILQLFPGAIPHPPRG